MLLHLTALLALSTQPPAAAPSPQAPDVPAALGQRIAAARAQTVTASTLVIVPDEPSYLAAIALWHTPSPDHNGARTLFPILIDDGSLPCHEDIARFARAFKPANTLRFTAKGEAPPPTPPAPTTAAALTEALAASWGAADETAYLAALSRREGSPGPLGAVVTDAADPSRTAAVALASAYGQVLLFAPPPAPASGTITFAAADALTSAITAQLTDRKIPFSALGDQIDTVTLCFNTPFKVTAGNSDAPSNPVAQLVAKPGEALALTDIIGRNTSGLRAQRWAFASQIPGTAAQAAYRAMSAVFLTTTSAVAFNGYEHSGEFGKYNPADGLQSLQAAGIQTAILDRPAQSIDDWRNWTAGGFAPAIRWTKAAGPQPKGGSLENDLFLVNTMGNSDFFQLMPGKGLAGDAPVLARPAAAHFVHSWSITLGADPWAVGGRWLDRGTFCYVGSVQEPYLSAFVPQSQFAQRLTLGWPIAAAGRIQPTDRPANPFSLPWRIAIIGDANWTIGPALKRTGATPALEGATDLSAELADHLKARRYAHALDTLAMLGRDDIAARLARAALNDEPGKIDIHAALRAVHAAYRAGDVETLVKAAQKIDLPDQRDLAVADEIWHALWPLAGSTMTADQAMLLSKTVRPYSYAWDTITAAGALKRTVGLEAARTFYEQSKAKAPRPDIQRELDAAASAVFR